MTAVEVNGVPVDAAAYFVIRPSFNSSGGYDPTLIDQGCAHRHTRLCSVQDEAYVVVLHAMLQSWQEA